VQSQTNTAEPAAAEAGVGVVPGVPAVLCVQQRDSDEIRRVLAALQAPMHECADGHAAIAAASHGPLSCAIVPLQMPDMRASALIGALREVAPGLAVFVVVDNPAVSEAVTVMRSGAHAVIDSRILSTGLMVHLAPLLRAR
jgi:DNA-binding NtrC family response regulator